MVRGVSDLGREWGYVVMCWLQLVTMVGVTCAMGAVRIARVGGRG